MARWSIYNGKGVTSFWSDDTDKTCIPLTCWKPKTWVSARVALYFKDKHKKWLAQSESMNHLNGWVTLHELEYANARSQKMKPVYKNTC